MGSILKYLVRVIKAIAGGNKKTAQPSDEKEEDAGPVIPPKAEEAQEASEETSTPEKAVEVVEDKPKEERLVIKKVDFSPNEYYQEIYPKRQIVIHHTASGKTGNLNGAAGDVNWWSTKKGRVATAFIIAGDGTVLQVFDPKFWGHHLGMKHPANRTLNKQSIAIEIDSWGPLTLVDGVYRSYVGTQVHPNNVETYSGEFKGYRFYERYTKAQLHSLKLLLRDLGEEFSIPLDYNADMWDLSENAIDGKYGVFTHVSYRSDKTDCHPQPDLIEALKSLT
jgi:hypothetical protein